MTVLAEFHVPAQEFVLVEAMTAVPEMRIEVKRVVAGDDFVTPYFVAAGGDFQTFDRALREDTLSQDVIMVNQQTAEGRETEDTSGERFYRVAWRHERPNLIAAIASANASIMEAVSEEGDEWVVTILLPDEQSLSTFTEYCDVHEFSIAPRRVFRPVSYGTGGQFGVSTDQYEALEAAYAAGYFHVPRDRNLTQLAEDLDLSRNAMSARLRRGIDNLLGHTFFRED